jgi:hypothetical protein
MPDDSTRTVLVALGAGLGWRLRKPAQRPSPVRPQWLPTILIHPGVTSSFAVAYIVLGISTVFDLVSFRQSAGQMIGAQPRLPARSLAADPDHFW